MPSRAPYNVRPQRRSSNSAKFTKVRIGDRRSIISSCEFHDNGKHFLTADYNGHIYISDSHNGFEKLTYLKGHKRAVSEVHYSRDGTSIYSGSLDKTVVIWDASRGARKSVMVGHQEPINSVQFTQDGDELICSGSSDKTIRLWDIRQRICGARLECEQAIATTCFSSCGNYIFAGGFMSGDIMTWDIRQSEIVYLMSGHTLAVTGLSLSPCGNFLASCSADNTIRTWDVSFPTEVNGELQRFHLLQSDLFHLRRCAWSPCGRLLTSGTTGRKGIIFDTHTGQPKRQLLGHRGTIIDIAFHPTRPMLVTTGADKSSIVHTF